MQKIVLQTFPSGISVNMLSGLLDEAIDRESVLKAILQRFEQRYGGSLEELESRLKRGEGQEHPDWEDSIEWRNATEALQRTRLPPTNFHAWPG